MNETVTMVFPAVSRRIRGSAVCDPGGAQMWCSRTRERIEKMWIYFVLGLVCFFLGCYVGYALTLRLFEWGIVNRPESFAPLVDLIDKIRSAEVDK